jgi:RNA polymerase sigma-70 factor (ECF subfamily)
LIRAAQAGSAEAIGELLQSCRTYLLAIGEKELSADLRIKVSASDLVQEAFVEGQRSIAQFQGQTKSEWQAWLRTILIHKLAHVRRTYQGTAARDIAREERQPNHSSILGLAQQIVDNDTPSRGAMRTETESALHAALARLPEDYRAVIKLRNFELASFAEIATRFERTEGAVRAMWLRAMKRLKAELPPTDEDEPTQTTTLPSPVASVVNHGSVVRPVQGENGHGQ